ncbi:MAG: hypothetical protein ABID35_04860 [Candidatus Margulisiibacteriota bacterium]
MGGCNSMITLLHAPSGNLGLKGIGEPTCGPTREEIAADKAAIEDGAVLASYDQNLREDEVVFSSQTISYSAPVTMSNEPAQVSGPVPQDTVALSPELQAVVSELVENQETPDMSYSWDPVQPATH